MSIADIIGPVDVYSGATASIMAIGFAVVVTTLVIKYQTRRKTDQQFEIERLRMENADRADARINDIKREIELGKISANRDVEVRRIESGMVDVMAVPERAYGGGEDG